jgi:aminopeptidase N
MKTETPHPIRLKDYRPSDYLIDEIDLDIKLAPQNTRVTAVLRVRPNPKVKSPSSTLNLDGEQIELMNLSLNGASLAQGEYEVDEHGLKIKNVPGAPFELTVETTCNPDENTALSGLYRTSDIYCTQCEAEGFRRITYYLDRPDILARYTVRIEARKSDAPTLLSNGNLIASGDIEGTERHFAVWQDPFPKPSYLFAMVAGNLASVRGSFVTVSGRQVDLRIYVEHGKQDRCDYAMDALKRSMRWDEEKFGREYDLDIFMIVAVSDFNMGAMENKGLNVFNDKYILALPDTATDTDYENIEAIIAHEYFHNWTGNRITCRDWFQLCLKEGLTVFRDQEFSADMRSAPVQRINDVRRLRSQQFPEDAGPLAHPVRPSSYIEINNFYTATVYEKGAELVRMMRTIMGDDLFRAAMDLYFERHDGEAATVEEFVACMADASGHSFKQFMNWYNQAGTPELAVNGRYVRQDECYELTVTQMCPPTPGQRNKQPYHVPLKLGLVGASGDDIPLVLEGVGPLERPVLEITESQAKFRFSGVTERPVPSLNRGYSAPVKLTSNIADDDLLFLMMKDSDPFNRWESAQSYVSQQLMSAVEDVAAGQDLNDDLRLAGALRACLRDQSLEPAFLALMLALPSENDLAAQIGKNVDPGAIHTAREHLKSSIGRNLQAELEDVYDRFAVKGPYRPEANDAGYRTLRNAALVLLCAAQGAERALEHYRAATNMTDAMAALSVLATHDAPQRTRALDDFYADKKDDHLLVDKWFALHAIAPFPERLEEIRALTDHEAFSLKTPNRVRALVGTFAIANPVCFNHPDGSGYRFVADTILALDSINPQVAARMAGAFKSWSLLEPGRKALAKSEVERIEQRKGLSRDTLEIVSKILH